MLAPWKKSYDKPRQLIKKQNHHLTDKGPHSQSYGFSSSHVWMWELDHKEVWAPKNWCFWTVVLEKTLESPLDFKGFKLVNPKVNQPWIFIGRTDAEADIPIFWPPDVKTWYLKKKKKKNLMLRKIEGKRIRGWQAEMLGWHYWLNGQEFEQTPGGGEGKGSLACYGPSGDKQLDMTEQLQQQG